jgi:transcriptional regulator with XRE-family HTH domain
VTDIEFSNKIPVNLLSIRKNLRYTQIQVAEMADIHSNYYAKVERGNSVPSLKTLIKIAKVLNVSVTDIVGY